MDTKPEGLSVIGEGIKFRSLSLEGVRGKVRATLTERQVSFESRSGHALDIRLDAIQRVHHHNTTLVPGWLAVVGCIMIWIAWRGVTGKLQALIGAAGIVMAAGHYITRRPTLTIDTKADDCHTVFGPDLAMMRLCSLIQRLQNGMSLSDAKFSVDSMVSDSEYPRHEAVQELELIPEPVEVFPSAVISHFIDSMELSDDEESLDAEIVSPAVVIEDLDLPIWPDEEEEQVPQQQISPGLIARSNSNLFTQRNNVIQHGWQPPEPQPAYNEVHRSNHVGPSYEMIKQQNYNHGTGYPIQNPQPTPIPTEFLPSFVGANGVHIPSSNQHVFTSPDSPLQAPDEEAPKQSLVASARRDVPIDAEIVPEESESPKDRYPHISKLSSKPRTRRITTRKGRSSRLRGKSVIAELVSPLSRAGTLSKKLFRRKSRTVDALRIQAENTRQSQVASSIQNLAKSNGGDVSDEEVNEMMAHLPPKPVIPSSFDDLVSSESKSKSSEDVSLIPRIDE